MLKKLKNIVTNPTAVVSGIGIVAGIVLLTVVFGNPVGVASLIVLAICSGIVYVLQRQDKKDK